MNIYKVIEDGLKQNNLDGLVNPGLCACLIGDLSPGSCLCSDCEGGIKYVHSITGDWVISPGKNQMTDDEIQACLDE